MACNSPLPINKFANNPILIGFAWKDSFTFATGTLASPTYLDLSLYNVYFAIAPSLTSSISLVPTITKLSNGLAIFEFSAVQTATMTAGTWVGHAFVQLISNGAPDFKMQLEITVIDPVPTP
ncbi:MAG: hypothetical protein EBR90_01380 [Actinobacteria bacterium]|nr:hypothetical protein [Actinomycetota bacterium]